jgi:hypothetical protein
MGSPDQGPDAIASGQAAVVADVALAAPGNGIVEIAGRNEHCTTKSSPAI